MTTVRVELRMPCAMWKPSAARLEASTRGWAPSPEMARGRASRRSRSEVPAGVESTEPATFTTA